MESFKLWFVSMLVIAVAGGGYFVYTQGLDYGAQKYARDALSIEIKEIEKENADLKKQKEQYISTVNESSTALSDNEEENKELDQYYSEISDYEEKISQLDKDLEMVNAENDKLSQYTSNLAGISNDVTGTAVALKDKTYQCPTDIAAGRYKVTGTGTFKVVSNVSNSIVDWGNMSSMDGNTYTFNLESNTRVTVEGELSFTPVN